MECAIICGCGGRLRISICCISKEVVVDWEELRARYPFGVPCSVGRDVRWLVWDHRAGAPLLLAEEGKRGVWRDSSDSQAKDWELLWQILQASDGGSGSH